MPRKYKEARLFKHLKVIEAAKQLGISQPTLSAWEGERKSPSVDGLENMADLYGVSTDFLLGRTDQCSIHSTQPIIPSSLPVFHGRPVWSPKHGWMLVNAIERVLILPTGQTIPFADSRDLYCIPPQFSESDLPSGEPLSHSEITQLDQIWLEPVSPDSDLRNELRGWYQVKERFVQNEYGNRFYMDTYGAKWLAFDFDEDKI